MDRLKQQIDFILEIDKMKNIYRQSYVTDASKHENDAEHSWHLAVMVMVLGEYFDKDTDTLKVMKMVLVHDLVEIYAGDTYLYDEKGYEDKAKREQEAADKLFAMLPQEQKDEFMGLWHEFEAKNTKESKFAAVLDRLQPVLLNYSTKGKAWLEHGVPYEKVREKQKDVFNGPKEISQFLDELLKDAVNKGYIRER